MGKRPIPQIISVPIKRPNLEPLKMAVEFADGQRIEFGIPPGWTFDVNAMELRTIEVNATRNPTDDIALDFRDATEFQYSVSVNWKSFGLDWARFMRRTET